MIKFVSCLRDASCQKKEYGIVGVSLRCTCVLVNRASSYTDGPLEDLDNASASLKMVVCKGQHYFSPPIASSEGFHSVHIFC